MHRLINLSNLGTGPAPAPSSGADAEAPMSGMSRKTKAYAKAGIETGELGLGTWEIVSAPKRLMMNKNILMTRSWRNSFLSTKWLKDQIRCTSTMTQLSPWLCLLSAAVYASFTALVLVINPSGQIDDESYIIYDMVNFEKYRTISTSIFGTLLFCFGVFGLLALSPGQAAAAAYGFCITAVAFTTHLLNYFGFLAVIYSPELGVYVSLVQMAEWAATVPLMAVALGHALRVAPRPTLAAAGANAAMLLLGCVAAPLAPGRAAPALLLGAGTALFLPFLLAVHRLTWRLRLWRGTGQTQGRNKKHIRLLGASVLLLWTLCPTLFFLEVAGVLSAQRYRLLSELADVASKGAFLVGLLLFHFQDEAAEARARAVDLAQGSAVQRTFLRFLFHEVRVPFHSLQLGLEHLAEGADEMMAAAPELGALLQMLQSAAGSMDRAIRDAAALSWLEDQKGDGGGGGGGGGGGPGGPGGPPPGLAAGAAPLCPRALVREGARAHRAAARRRGLRLKCLADRRLPPAVVADRALLLKVLDQLLSNAIKFTPAARGSPAALEARAAGGAPPRGDGGRGGRPASPPAPRAGEGSSLIPLASARSAGEGGGGGGSSLIPLASARSAAAAAAATGGLFAHKEEEEEEEPPPEVVVSAELVQLDRSEGVCIIALKVSDQGVGIPDLQQGSLFEGVFEQRSHASSQPGSPYAAAGGGEDGERGSGLGLRLAKQIVELHQGRLTCKSRVGAGSEFVATLRLPLPAADRGGGGGGGGEGEGASPGAAGRDGAGASWAAGGVAPAAAGKKLVLPVAAGGGAAGDGGGGEGHGAASHRQVAALHSVLDGEPSLLRGRGALQGFGRAFQSAKSFVFRLQGETLPVPGKPVSPCDPSSKKKTRAVIPAQKAPSEMSLDSSVATGLGSKRHTSFVLGPGPPLSARPMAGTPREAHARGGAAAAAAAAPLARSPSPSSSSSRPGGGAPLSSRWTLDHSPRWPSTRLAPLGSQRGPRAAAASSCSSRALLLDDDPPPEPELPAAAAAASARPMVVAPEPLTVRSARTGRSGEGDGGGGGSGGGVRSGAGPRQFDRLRLETGGSTGGTPLTPTQRTARRVPSLVHAAWGEGNEAPCFLQPDTPNRFLNRAGSRGFTLSSANSSFTQFDESRAISRGVTLSSGQFDESPSVPLSPMSKKGWILVVDDAASILKLTKLILSKEYNVDTAENGQEAVDKALTKAYDVILMDFMMPIMDGPEATRRILKERPGQKIIGVTGNALQEDQRVFLAAGAAEVLLKPCRKDALLASIGRHVGGGGDRASSSCRAGEGEAAPVATVK